MDELKIIFASNLIRLRTQAGMTQAELGKQLSYSDKTISKWERAEAIPDAGVLMQMSRMFQVTVDYLLTEHDSWQPPEKPASFSRGAVTAVSVTGLWTLTVLIFSVMWITGRILWIVFPISVALTIILLLVFNSLWNNGRGNMFIVMALVLCLILVIYLLFFRMNMWQLFLVVIPAELVVFFSFRIRGRSRKKNKKQKKTDG